MRENKPQVFNLLKIHIFRSSFKFVSMRSWHQPMRGIINLMAKRSMKIRGKGHLATKTNELNGLNEVQKIHQEKQRVTSDIFASSESSAFDFFGPGFLLDLPQGYFSL